MKSKLLGTTALVAVGMFALADTAVAQTKVQPIQVNVGGFVGEFVSYTDQDNFPSAAGGNGRKGEFTKLDEWSDKEIHFNGRTTLDNGLTVGFRVELEGNTHATDQIDESYMFIEGRFGRVELGSLNNVQYRMSYNAPEAQTRAWLNEGNIVNVMFNPTGSAFEDSMLGNPVSRFRDNDSEKINYYTPRFEGFQLGVSYIPNSSQDRNALPETMSTAYSRGWAAGANFQRTFGAFDVGASAGYMRWQGPQLTATTSADDPYQWNLGLQIGYAGFKVGGAYGKIKDGRSGGAGTAASASAAGTGAFRSEGTGWDAGILYAFGPASVSLGYIRGTNDDNPVSSASDDKDKFTMLELAGKYVIGPGVSLEAVLWSAKFSGNGSTGGDPAAVANADNKATGALGGVVLVF